MKLLDWCLEYIDTYKKYTLKPSTFDSYKHYCSHINIEKELEEITALDVQRMVNEMLSKRLSNSTIKHTLVVVRLALRQAYKLGMIADKTIAEDVELPRARPQRVIALTDREQDIIRRNAGKSHYGDFFLALLYTGMRVGELIALQWHDVDLINRIIYVTGTMYKGQINSPKTESSEREIPISDELYPIICKYTSNRKYVFLNTIGSPIDYRSVLDAWHRYLEVCGIYRSVGLHVLRHTFATNAVAAGVNLKALSAILGHRSVAITLDIYTNVTLKDKQKVIQTISRNYFAHTPSHDEQANFN